MFVNPNIPALKYGGEIEVNAVNKLKCILFETHKYVKIVDCGLYLDEQFPYIGASPDRIILCASCPKSCLEVKCPFSINLTAMFLFHFHCSSLDIPDNISRCYLISQELI